MQCCEMQPMRNARRGWWRSASVCTGSGVLLVLLPKCPLCLAAYLGLWMGASWAMPLAQTARPLLLIALVACSIWVLTRIIAGRVRA